MFSFFKKKPVEPIATPQAPTPPGAAPAAERAENRDESEQPVHKTGAPSAAAGDLPGIATVTGTSADTLAKPNVLTGRAPDLVPGSDTQGHLLKAPDPAIATGNGAPQNDTNATAAVSATSAVRNWLRKPFMRPAEPDITPAARAEPQPQQESELPLGVPQRGPKPGTENRIETISPALPRLGQPPVVVVQKDAPAATVAPVDPPVALAKTAPNLPAASAVSVPVEPAVAPEAMLAPSRTGWMDRLRGGLRKTGSSITTVFTGTRIDDALYEELEDALLMADTGVKATQYLLIDLKRRVKESRTTEPAAVRGLLADALTDLLRPLEKSLVVGEFTPTVIMVAGVNGAGKTTSIGKLTAHLAQAGASVLLAAADTFRAAAREQLGVWADRNTVEIISQEGGDAAAVSYDAVTAGRARRRDVVLIDTAGRLPTQLHLMEELRKIKRTVAKAANAPGNPGMGQPPHEVLLVIDGNTGQNALAQVRAFDDALQLTGLIVTKLDGTAKGGVLAAIAQERPLPVYFIGVGEKLEDLETFSAREFAQALLT